MALAFCGLLAIMWLGFGPESPASRAAASAIGAMSIVTLAWHHRRRAGDASREAELLARRLVEENIELEHRLHQAEDDHRSLEHYFETLMEHIPANIYFKDADSHFLKVNQSMAESFGCGHPADMLGKTDHDFFESEHADQALRDEQEIISSGRGITGKVEHETFSKGREGWVLTTKMPFRDRSGRIIGTFGMSSDVTELMQTRNTLERERNVLRSLIDSFPDKIFVRDPGRHYLVVNKAMAEWVGADSPEEMLGKTPDDYFPEAIARAGAREDLDMLASGKPVLNREWTFDMGGQGVRYLVTTKVPLVEPDGRCWGIVGMDRDMTEYKLASEKLEQTERQLQELMDNSPAVISLKDRGGRYQMVNRGFEELFGLERGDVLGRRDDEFIADKDVAARFRAIDEEVMDKREPVQLDEQLYVDGEPRWYVSVKFPLFDSEGQIHAVASISTDITDRKVAEDAMQQLNDELVRANDDLQQAHEQLIQAEKMESIGRLASGVAHEVKNPLAMIGMGLELLARRIPEEDASGREALDRMKRGIERAKRIIKGLVDFSSARQLALEPSDVNQVVQDAIALVEYQLRKGKVTLADEFAEDLPRIELDATRIEQVLVNLMINAMQAMETGGQLTVRTYATFLTDAKRDEGVRTATHLRAGDRVIRIEIDDQGPGIDPENLKKLFDPFFTTKPTGVGTGLGLSVSRKIVELHHGTLELINRDEGGVRARITLKCPEAGR
ncbi:PAS/PAC sensor signal transducation histidine kinase [Haloferula helveola]|uniref:histidine kinase n=1 Tax=Haloferula helveola TaxID=490095 RepID=A0ABM7RA15_9BACT|nr:PAS/PAC sensor signal transducation histidine kinase [Haloferula helveola]